MTIIYIDQMQLLDPRISSVTSRYSYNWNNLISLSSFNPNNHQYIVRSGKNILPYNNAIVGQLGFAPPAFDKTFNYSISEITDNRYNQLMQSHNDRPWIVYWSGGVDSTSVVTSILKNSSPADRARIYIACNKISVYENPRFYYDHILPNFATMDSTLLVRNEKLLTDYYLITGEYSDQMFSGSISMSLQQKDINVLDRNLFREPEQLLDHVNLKMKDRSATEWFYQQLVDNIQSVDVPITTCHDFLWWFWFNLMWVNIKFRPILTATYTPELMRLYLKSYIAWFDNDDYQHWAMNNNRAGLKYGNHLGEYKLELKRYIHNFNHDEYYFKFKTKGSSLGRPAAQLNWFCLLDDFTTLNLDDDLEQILELLPAFIV